MKLINAIAQSTASLGMAKDHDLSAYRFHSDLFLSGLERIILVSDCHRESYSTSYKIGHNRFPVKHQLRTILRFTLSFHVTSAMPSKQVINFHILCLA